MKDQEGSMELSVVGKSVFRVDAFEKVTGQAVFCDDIKLPRMLCSKLLRSPLPHARILRIDTSKAERVPGVKAILTGKDVPKKRFGITVFDQTVLAIDLVRYIGEPVAAIAAETIEIAEESAELIEVEFEELPAVFDAEEAMSVNPKVIIHPGLFSYSRTYGALCPNFDLDRPNVHFHYKLRKGVVEKGFQEADLIVENRFSSARVQQCAIEPHVAIAQVDGHKGLTIYTGRQILFRVKHQLSDLLDIPPSKIRVISPYIGGAFGSKIVLVPSPIVAVLAMRTGRPVKLVFNREEVFYGSVTRGSMVVYVKDGVKKDGTLMAREVRAIINGGAYSETSGICIQTSATGMFACYQIPNIKFDGYAVYTNEPLCGAFRGLNVHLTNMAAECQMNIIAKKLCIDPIEIRRKNFLKDEEENFCGEIVQNIGVEKCLEEIIRPTSEFSKPEQVGMWRFGKGVAVANQFSSPASSSAIVKVCEDGLIEVRHSANEIGQGCNTIVAQIAAQEFSVSMDAVRVVYTDTAITPFDAGSVGSHTTYTTGNAVRLACQDAKRLLLELSAKKLGVSPQDLETSNGRVYLKKAPETVLMISTLFRPGGYLPYGAEIIGKATFMQDPVPINRDTGQIECEVAREGKRLMAFYTYGAQAVEVAVNVETGEVKVLRLISAFDMGQPINPKMCEQQMEGGMGMGIGTGLYEEMRMDRGVVLNPNFTDYRIPTMKEIPSQDNIKLVIAPTPHKEGPYGAKGLGECVMMPTPPAIANAIYEATGVMITDIPITAERLLMAIKKNERLCCG